MTIVPPHEENGYKFETTGYIVYMYLPEIRSYVSLSPSWTAVVSLAMEHFLNNTQGQCGEKQKNPKTRSLKTRAKASILCEETLLCQCYVPPGVCGVGSCVRKGGLIEADDCCDKTAHDWVYDDPLKPACDSAPRSVPCHTQTPPGPSSTPLTTTSCPQSTLCELLDHA